MRQVSEKGSPGSAGSASWPSSLIVGEPGKRSRRAWSSDFTSTSSTSASTPSSPRIRLRSPSVSGWEGQPSHQSSSTLMHLHPLDDRVLHGAVAGAGLGALDRVDGVHPVGDLAEDGVLAVEPGSGVCGHDEELAALVFGPRLAIANAPRTIL